MIAIEVGETTAALEGDGVLTCIVSIVRHAGGAPDIQLHLTGLADGERRTWIDASLAVGDTLTLRIVDVEAGDAPQSATPAPAVESERELYERLKRTYGP